MTKYLGLIAIDSRDGRVVCGGNGDAILFNSTEQAEKAGVCPDSVFLRVVRSSARIKKLKKETTGQ